MGKQHGSAGLEGRPIDFRFHEFRLDYEQTKHLSFKNGIHSDPFSAGSDMWRISCYPYVSPDDNDKVEYITIFIQPESKTGSISAIIDVSFMDKDGKPSLAAGRRTGVYLFEHEEWGWVHLVRKTDLVKKYVIEGHIRIVCGIMVVNGCSIKVPPSDIGEHLGTLLDSTDGTDVSFIIDSETFHAHRAVLAARSPVFRAELLGSMAEATASSITLHGITPATFKLMLRFMYTDRFPGDGELGDCPTRMIQHLLAAADRYSLDRLKLMCAQKLWDNVSIDTVAATLACAEMYNCLELKNKCIDFFAMEKLISGRLC